MFGYLELLKKLDTLDKNISIETIGKSEFGRDIFSLRRGMGGGALIHGGIHAREHITSLLVFELAVKYMGENITFVPLANPDGAELCIRGIETADKNYREFLLDINANERRNKYDFALWKANGRAVDLNVNFDAGWGNGASNVRAPSSGNFIGEHPFSEKETRALRDLTLRNNYTLTISYHSKGEVIYWGYGDNYEGERVAIQFAELTHYSLERSNGSDGGYKDWFSLFCGRLGITIEVGRDIYPHPFPYSQFRDIMNKNKRVTELVDKVVENGY
ncbi:MAG: hypothetical protein EOM87_06150 [Clostridia bacterium]|nr:hypothetical protein [Clostridia bacterium]